MQTITSVPCDRSSSQSQVRELVLRIILLPTPLPTLRPSTFASDLLKDPFAETDPAFSFIDSLAPYPLQPRPCSRPFARARSRSRPHPHLRTNRSSNPDLLRLHRRPIETHHIYAHAAQIDLDGNGMDSVADLAAPASRLLWRFRQGGGGAGKWKAGLPSERELG